MPNSHGSALAATFSRLLDLTDELKFDRRNPRQLAGICLYARMLELAIGVVSLVEARASAGVPVLIRAILEAYASLLGVIQFPDHVDHLLASYLSEKIRVIKAARKPGASNPLLAELTAYADAELVLSDFEAQLEEVSGRGGRVLTVRNSFDRAGLEAEFESLYWLFSLESHNNLQALEVRHIREAGDDYHVCMLEIDAPSAINPSLGVVLSSCLNAHQHLRSFLGVPFTEEFTNTLKVLTEFEASLSPPAEE